MPNYIHCNRPSVGFKEWRSTVFAHQARMDFFCDFDCALDVIVDPHFGFIVEKSQKFMLAYPTSIEIVHATIAQGLNKRFAATRRKRLHDIFPASACAVLISSGAACASGESVQERLGPRGPEASE